MLAHSNNWKDVKKYFEGTYIVCPEYDPKKILMVEHVEPVGMKVSDVDKVTGYIDWSENTYNIHSPLATRRAWFQHQSAAYLMQRIPARMWRKGICDQNTTCRTITTDGNVTNGILGVSLAQSFLLSEELEQLPKELDGYSSIALNKRFVLHNKSNRLYLYHCPVGTISIPKQHISILKEFAHMTLPKSIRYWDVAYV